MKPKRTPLSKQHETILRDVLTLPTAPFAEHFVIDFIKRFCRERNLSAKRDSAGNLLIRVRRGRRKVARPVCLTAHLDHPGFVADRMTDRRLVRAFWRGGVAPEYFVGSRVRFFVDGAWIIGTIREIETTTRDGVRRVQTAGIEVRKQVPPRSIGMWDLPDPVVRGSQIHARACDDLAGAAAMLCCIDFLTRTSRSCDAYFLFTRAEEVGFIGALAAASLKTIPPRCLVVAMETSSQRPNAIPGDGPILRVGDKTSTFTPAATSFCRTVADDVAKKHKSFCYQRRLMDGGTCESSAYCARGYDATGLCVALGNYHNMDVQKKRIAAEFVDLTDLANVILWFNALAQSKLTYSAEDVLFDRRLDKLERDYRGLLRASVSEPT